MGVLDSLTSFDAYPKTLGEFTEKTFSGAAISVGAVLAIGFLVWSELSYYSAVIRKDELYVDTAVDGKMDIHFDITFPSISCGVLSIDTMDAFGESQMDVDHDVTKVRLDLSGNVISSEKQRELGEDKEEVKVAEKALAVNQSEPGYCGSCWGAETEEGCRISGTLQVSKVQGNFHFAPGKSFQSAKSHVHDYMPFELDHFNVSHKVNKLAFGAEFPGRSDPLDDRKHYLIDGSSGLFQYFLKVVPTTYEDIDGVSLESSQFSVTEHFKKREADSLEDIFSPFGRLGGGGGSVVPGVFFIYDLSPIMVHIKETHRHTSTLHFVVSLCAAIGGIFTIAGLFDGVVHRMISSAERSMYGK